MIFLHKSDKLLNFLPNCCINLALFTVHNISAARLFIGHLEIWLSLRHIWIGRRDLWSYKLRSWLLLRLDIVDYAFGVANQFTQFDENIRASKRWWLCRSGVELWIVDWTKQVLKRLILQSVRKLMGHFLLGRPRQKMSHKRGFLWFFFSRIIMEKYFIKE